jgi:hypothetical protein
MLNDKKAGSLGTLVIKLNVDRAKALEHNIVINFYTKIFIFILCVSSISYKYLFFILNIVKGYCNINKYMIVYLS